MKKYFIIVNKMAQKSKAENIWVTIKQTLDNRNIEYLVKYTTEILDAKKITTRFIKNLNHKDYESYVIIAIGGIQLFSIGVMGQYIGKTYMEVKDRPHYIISKTNKKDSTDIK